MVKFPRPLDPPSSVCKVVLRMSIPLLLMTEDLYDVATSKMCLP